MIVNKIVPPNKLISEPFGTIHSIQNDAITELYIQISHDKENPHWIPMGEFLVSVFESEFTNQEFIDSCLDKYSSNPCK